MSPTTSANGFLLLMLVLASSLVITFAAVTESRSLSQYVREAKDYLVAKAKKGLISRSTMLTSFQEAMDQVERDFKQAKADGKLEGKDEQEAQTFYYKLVAEQMHRLRARIEADKSGKLGQVIGQSVAVDLPDAIEQVVDAKMAGKLPDRVSQEVLDMDMDLDESIDGDWDLINEMDDIEKLWLQEAEYGKSLSEADIQRLKMRTRVFMRDLMSNEIQQLATAVVAAYMAGKPSLPVAMAILTVAQHKFFDYFINCIMDILSSLMGRQVELVPVEELETKQA